MFNKFGPFFWGEQNSDTKVAPSALGDERSNVEGVSNVDVVPFFAASWGAKWRDGDGWRDGMSSTAIGDPVHLFHWDRWKNSPVERRPSKIRVNQRSAIVLEEKTLQLETHSLQLA